MKTVQLDDIDHARLKELAARHRRSMPQEVGLLIEQEFKGTLVEADIPMAYNTTTRELLGKPVGNILDTTEPKSDESTASDQWVNPELLAALNEPANTKEYRDKITEPYLDVFSSADTMHDSVNQDGTFRQLKAPAKVGEKRKPITKKDQAK